MAARRVKVVLSGDGGDEVFGGYKRYLEAINGLRFAKIPEAIRKSWILPIASHLPVGAPGRNFLYSIGSQVDAAPGYRLGIYPFIKEKLYNPSLKKRLEDHNPFEVTDRSLRESSHLDIVSRLQYLDISDYLHNDILVKVDRMSMAHSIELRSPILDYKVMEFMAGIPPRYRIFGGVTKVLFRKLLKGLLPAEAFDKPKQGFGIPGESWFREDLRDFAASTILEGNGMTKEYLDIGMVRKIFREHEKGRRDYSEWIWCLLVLELWHKRFGASAEGAGHAGSIYNIKR
jgi:asparagine synthase (glutamine-hydrolysing)